jgi:hypothetical protein
VQHKVVPVLGSVSSDISMRLISGNLQLDGILQLVSNFCDARRFD